MFRAMMTVAVVLALAGGAPAQEPQKKKFAPISPFGLNRPPAGQPVKPRAVPKVAPKPKPKTKVVLVGDVAKHWKFVVYGDSIMKHHVSGDPVETNVVLVWDGDKATKNIRWAGYSDPKNKVCGGSFDERPEKGDQVLFKVRFGWGQDGLNRWSATEIIKILVDD